MTLESKSQHTRDHAFLQAPGLNQLNVAHLQDEQQLMGSPRIQQDELSGGLIIAPGSETTASVSEPLADIAGGKSGTDAQIENPYEQRPTAGTAAEPSSGNQAGQLQAAVQSLGQQNPAGANSSASPEGAREQVQGAIEGTSGASLTPERARGQIDGAKPGAAIKGDEYSDQQQAQQASSGCKQS